MTTVLTPFRRSETAGAWLMASAWAGYHAALWQGDPAASGFAEWLAEFWEPSLARPAGTPDARNPRAAGGRGIDWFEREGWVSGHIPGLDGGYLVARTLILDHPWMAGVAMAA
ncbi:MAG: hypothetical protein M3Q50_08660 [Chloroflexota bacterium]|nr:hypothetical protein [Chloroflexia bacterium]MDQ3226685.1 hypothetical protein [Chloroflexota bacterium]